MTQRPRAIYYVAQSLDGFIADPHHCLDWLLRFDQAEGVQATYEQFMQGVGAIVMGAVTYEFVLNQGPWPYASLPTWVFANHPRPVPTGADVRFAGGDVSTAFAAIAAAASGRDVWLVGGGRLVADFAAAGWLDELHVCIVPVTLGSGVPLLPGRRHELVLHSVQQLGCGLLMLKYER